MRQQITSVRACAPPTIKNEHNRSCLLFVRHSLIDQALWFCLVWIILRCIGLVWQALILDRLYPLLSSQNVQQTEPVNHHSLAHGRSRLLYHLERTLCVCLASLRCASTGNRRRRKVNGDACFRPPPGAFLIFRSDKKSRKKEVCW